MASAKQFINKPGTCVEEMLNGVASTYPGLSMDIHSKVTLYAKNSPSSDRKVGLLSGGGSGHEPFAAGFVGEGMLTGSVAGSVFSSPPSSHILTAICNVASVSPGGVMVLILNYTGDVLNFGLAVERAKQKGYKVNYITIDEDCAIDSPEGSGKRGLCGTLFMIKIAGGMTMMGKSLEEIYYECALIKKKIATLGITVKPCNLPGVGLLFKIEEGFMEVGVGIHGEAGASRMKMVPADEVVHIILSKLCITLNIKEGDRVCTIINNLGGSSQLELYLVAGEVARQLKKKGVEVVRQYTGSLITSLDMAGIQVSMLVLPSNERLWLDCLDAPTTAFAWPGNSLSLPVSSKKEIFAVEKESDNKLPGTPISDKEAFLFKECLIAVAKEIQKDEQQLNELDKGCGDGDTGSTLRRMADGILKNLESIPFKYPQQSFIRLSELAEHVMGGTSGALYSLMFMGASKDFTDWVSSAQLAVNMMMNYSKARVGNRTLFDALIPACETFKEEISKSGNWKESLKKAVEAADDGCKKTRHYKPLYGRASYVNESNLTNVDAGAYGVTVWLHGIQSVLT